MASILLVVALVGGTAAAFGITERLKLERSPVFAPRIDKVFSPVCDCPKALAKIRFSLRKADRITVVMVDRSGDPVRRLLASRDYPAGPVSVSWDGRDDAGRIVSESSYRPRVHLDHDRRTIVFPNPIAVDVTPPRLAIAGVRPRAFSPDRDGRNELVRVAYRVDEPAHALLFVNGVQRVRGRFQRREDALQWFGKVDGHALPAGRYELSLAAEDLAGNVSRRTAPVAVEIRYIELARDLVRVRARTRFGIGVRTDARSFRWRFAGGTGTARPGVLVLRAPRPGRYRLFVETRGHADSAVVIVTSRGR
jgi:hypothetical protein